MYSYHDRCHGNDIWGIWPKIGYCSVCIRDVLVVVVAVGGGAALAVAGVVVPVVVVLPSDFVQLRITSSDNKTANIYVTKLFSSKGDVVVGEINCAKSQLKTQTSPLHIVRRTLLTV